VVRAEFVRRLVLGKICDDYENVDQIILRDVAEDGAKCGLVIERSEVVDALAKLIAQGLAKAYLLSGTEPFSVELKDMPLLEAVEEDFKTYFLATETGIKFHVSDDKWWPLRDEGGGPDGS
jgi:hypothetical protein